MASNCIFGCALLDESIEITRRVDAGHLELRRRSNHHLDMPSKTGKLAVVKAVSANADAMFRGPDKKVRVDVRKS